MNNQSNLIDAEKVFRWAELCVIPVRAEDIRRAHALGLFAPDHVPTFKPGDGVRHEIYGNGIVMSDAVTSTTVQVDFDLQSFSVPVKDLEPQEPAIKSSDKREGK